MNAVRGFARLRFLETFEKDFRKLDRLQQSAVEDCIRDLRAPVIPAGRRWHCVDRQQRPPVFTVDLFSNKSYKISCHIEQDSEGQVLVLRRVAMHKVIDRNP
ncbi:MAG: hypothetical protein MZW92_04840 [Comamonadaceae bacterium]|nr:hypothetical protein [Comamonadaceae bacterium]